MSAENTTNPSTAAQSTFRSHAGLPLNTDVEIFQNLPDFDPDAPLYYTWKESTRSEDGTVDVSSTRTIWGKAVPGEDCPSKTLRLGTVRDERYYEDKAGWDNGDRLIPTPTPTPLPFNVHYYMRGYSEAE